MVNQYKKFYKSVIDFIKKTDKTSFCRIKGYSEDELKALENKFDVIIPEALKEKLKVIGRSFSFYKHYTLELNLLEQMEDLLIMRKETDGFRELELYWCKPRNIKLLPLFLAEDREYFAFADQNSSNGIYYGLEVLHYQKNRKLLEEDTYARSTYVQDIREEVWLYLSIIANKHGYKYEISPDEWIDFSGIDWINFHIKSNTFLEVRSDFAKLAKQQQEQLGIIWTFEEYEIEYIKFLIEIGRSKPIPEVFDPYVE